MSAPLILDLAALVRALADLPDDHLCPLLDRLEELRGGASTPEPVSPFVTAEEAADLLRCRRRRIYELVGDGRLGRYGDGRRLLLRRADVLRLASGDA